MDQPADTGLLVVGHGTRHQRGRCEYEQLLATIAEQLSPTPVEGCFLELAEPDIGTGMQRLKTRGVDQVVVLPLLLFAAGHAKIDIPRESRAAAAVHGLTPLFAAPLGNHPEMLALSAQQFNRALEQRQLSARQVQWLFVGRGSKDPEATADFQRFFESRQQLTPVAKADYGFLAMALPRVENQIESIRETPQQWVIVQPHLLFEGELLERLVRIVDAANGRDDQRRWLLVPHLGAAELAAAAAIARFHEAQGGRAASRKDAAASD